MVITFIGYRGCGKSTVAALLSARLGWACVDADDAIESRAGCSISELFAERGEPVFRELERTVIAELLGRERLVLAAGGGAILAKATRAAMRGAGPVVWLQAPVADLSRRISGDGSTALRRPQLTDAGVTAEIESVLTAREPLYRDAATIVIDTAGRTVEDVAAAVYVALPDEVTKDQ
ncbi:Shikimate kinase 2 [Symmachiella dynata]|uniref:shikimate kinase n=1 Tax=Symmachiella dynata TaxID=2527995 RepID=UPI00118A67F4|nr:shikimate kinase [Symmachiella dynata]QDT47061.1 Shikimate kinase 2 [Symmachiella dynata]